ncbi:hypothetical protein ANCCAN_27799, partial [Ancylostoma caninum]
RILGKNGSKIDAIRAITGVKVDIGCSGDDGFTPLSIYGDYRRIVLAVNMMVERLESLKPGSSVYERPDRKEFFEQLHDAIDDN